MIKLTELTEGVLGIELSGTLHDEDYRRFVPAVDEVVAARGKARLLVRFHEFHGWDAKALWNDIKFATTHCTKIDRIALVGESRWEAWMAKVCKPFTMASVKYFDASDSESAERWIRESAGS